MQLQRDPARRGRGDRARALSHRRRALTPLQLLDDARRQHDDHVPRHAADATPRGQRARRAIPRACSNRPATCSPGSPTLPCASVAAFLPSGGWAIVGSQNIRYTGISGNALLGIPASGPGAITATITYNTTAVAAAMLTGIPTTGLGVIKYTMLKGDPVNVFVQVDDLAAQAAVRAQLARQRRHHRGRNPGRPAGLHARASTRCQARLDLLGALDSEGKVGVITVTYVCRDMNTIAGATVDGQPRAADQPARRLPDPARRREAIPHPEPAPDLHRRGVEHSVLAPRKCCVYFGKGRSKWLSRLCARPWIDDDGTGTTGTVINNAVQDRALQRHRRRAREGRATRGREYLHRHADGAGSTARPDRPDGGTERMRLLASATSRLHRAARRGWPRSIRSATRASAVRAIQNTNAAGRGAPITLFYNSAAAVAGYDCANRRDDRRVQHDARMRG